MWSLARPAGEIDLAVPESVRSMIGKKLEVLEDEDRRALQYASVQGEEFLSTVLAASLEVDELALEERLDRLERLHRLIQTRSEEELPDGSLATRYRFAHALLSELSLRRSVDQTPHVAAPSGRRGFGFAAIKVKPRGLPWRWRCTSSAAGIFRARSSISLRPVTTRVSSSYTRKLASISAVRWNLRTNYRRRTGRRAA